MIIKRIVSSYRELFMQYDDSGKIKSCWTRCTFNDHRENDGEHYYANIGIEEIAGNQFKFYITYETKDRAFMNQESFHESFQDAWKAMPALLTTECEFNEFIIEPDYSCSLCGSDINPQGACCNCGATKRLAMPSSNYSTVGEDILCPHCNEYWASYCYKDIVYCAKCFEPTLYKNKHGQFMTSL